MQQASAIPYRLRDGRLEFCLITSLNSGGWAFPKGLVDPGETIEETAAKEAHEEAGLQGRIHYEPIGTYQYTKWRKKLNVTVVLMEVSHCEEQWEESGLRQRRWVSSEEAIQLLGRAELKQFLREAVRRVKSG